MPCDKSRYGKYPVPWSRSRKVKRGGEGSRHARSERSVYGLVEKVESEQGRQVEKVLSRCTGLRANEVTNEAKSR